MSQRSFLTNFARENLQTLNLRRFFGDYRTFAFDPEYFHLGIGEIANITDDATWQRVKSGELKGFSIEGQAERPGRK